MWYIVVAPHDGCVDWNMNIVNLTTRDVYVAPHDGCVDWNYKSSEGLMQSCWSHPTMGAWIEI